MISGPTKIVITQHFENAAVCDPSAPALFDHAFQFMTECMQTLDTAVYLAELRLRNCIRGIARLIWVVRETDQIADCLQWEPEISGMPNERQTVDGRVIVNALVST